DGSSTGLLRFRARMGPAQGYSASELNSVIMLNVA
nr:hypothetical protein [Tanacetum cinerariifolium]